MKRRNWATRQSLSSAQQSLSKHPQPSRISGFTIVELLIVVVVIAILATISVVAYNNVTGRARASALATSLSQAAKKIQVYATTNNDTLPADQTAFDTLVPATSDTTYQYTPNTAVSPSLFCITATSGGVSSHIATGGTPTDGPCTGHTGTSPTVAANGEACPTGYIVVPGSSLYNTKAFCVMKYEAKNDGSGNAISQANPAYPWVGISQTSAISTAAAACSGCHLITENEWLTIAQNVLSVGSNWSGGTIGSGALYSGHNDGTPAQSITASVDDNNGWVNTGQTSGAQRRTLTLTNGQVIWDFAGNVREWTSGTTEGENQPGSPGGMWRNWNNLTIPGSLSPNPHPSYGNPSNIGWTTAYGVGSVFSDSSSTALSAFLRSGYWGEGSNAGAFTLLLNYSPSQVASHHGFRVAR